MPKMSKIFKYSNTSNNNNLILIKSEHPEYTYEVYFADNGIFAGYMGNRESELRLKENKIINQQ